MTGTTTAALSPPLARLLRPSGRAERMRHLEQVPARAERTAEWPEWVPPLLVDRLRLKGVAAPWTHQVAGADAAWNGRSVVVATGTASGKSLAYQLPLVSALLTEDATALYLSPT